MDENGDFEGFSCNISETVYYVAQLTINHQQEMACGLSIGISFDDLE